MHVSFKLNDNDLIAKILKKASEIEGKKPGDIAKEVLRKCIARLCIEDSYWKHMICAAVEPIEVKVLA